MLQQLQHLLFSPLRFSSLLTWWLCPWMTRLTRPAKKRGSSVARMAAAASWSEVGITPSPPKVLSIMSGRWMLQGQGQGQGQMQAREGRHGTRGGGMHGGC